MSDRGFSFFSRTNITSWIASILTLALIVSSSLVSHAAAPNPGHTWTEMGDVLVTVSQGGTGVTGAAQGDLLYASAPNTFSELAKNTTATRYLANTGANNNPQWDQINLTNGVTGTLPAGNGGTGSAFVSFSGPTASRTYTLPDANATLLTTGSTLGIANGGTGVTTLLNGGIVIGNGTSPVTTLTPRGKGDMIMSLNGTSWTVASTTNLFSLYKASTTQVERWYTAPVTGTALTTGAPTANTLRAIPFPLSETVVLDRIAINVTTLLAGQARLGIYEDNGNMYPGARVLDAGTVDSGSAGVKAITINQTLQGGKLYWLVIVGNAAPTIRTFAVASMLPLLGFDNTLGTAPGLFYSVAYTYAALPATFPTGAAVGTAVPIPAIFVRISS